jgi:plastocyanin
MNMRYLGTLTIAGGLVLGPLGVCAAELEIGQKGKTFVQNDQKVETVRIKTGDTIHFRNHDPFFHNVFSLSESQTFDLGSYPAGNAKSVRFEKAGTIEVECAIHPQMLMTIEVK